MATTSAVLRSLATLSHGSPVFEPDQVLTHGQLNRLSDWFDDQGRLTRVRLIGVGLVDGLQVALTDAGVRITRGLGLSTDGDLIELAETTQFSSWRPYDREAPRYEPFYTGPETMRELVELVAPGDEDTRTRPLMELPGALPGRVVVALMESVENDPDLCNGTDCDNLGRDALHRLRWLLCSAEDAAALQQGEQALLPACERARALPEVQATAPRLQGLNSTQGLAQACLTAGDATLEALATAFSALASTFGERVAALCGNASAPLDWVARLRQRRTEAASRSGGGPLWLEHLGDLVDTWGALREQLFLDDSVLLPELGAFPKHLLLGQLGAPRQFRSGLYPAPSSAGTREAAAHASFLIWKLHLLVGAFVWPQDTTLRVTPSRTATAPLEERAIPWYYTLSGEFPLQTGWHYLRAARGQQQSNLGYRVPADRRGVPPPLSRVLLGHDFFRVEGHLGQPVRSVRDALRAQIRQFQLPFTVRAVLLHTDRARLVLRPSVRVTDLHRFHHLLRQDLQVQLADGLALHQRQSEQLRQAVDDTTVPRTVGEGVSVIDAATNTTNRLGTLQKDSAPVLQARRYGDYRALGGGGTSPNWIFQWGQTLGQVAQTRSDLGTVARTDFSAAHDGLLLSNRPHWLQWLDQLIDHRDAQQDDRLLMPNFLAENPGAVHAGGVPRGGTLVLVYDDQGRVITDLALDHWEPEEDEDEPDLPPLQVLPWRPDLLRERAVRIIRPLDMVLNDRVSVVRAEVQKDWLAQFDAQKSYLDGVFKYTLLPGKLEGFTFDTGNGLVDMMAERVGRLQEDVRKAQTLAASSQLSSAERERADTLLQDLRGQLAEAVVQTTQQLLVTEVDVGVGGRGAAVPTLLTGAIAQVGGGTVGKELQGRLGKLQGGTDTKGGMVQRLQQFSLGLQR
ncbi:hypothetical protein KAK07_22485 [Ideonella sp. 4Y16]|uniref:Uncharacterized protein n=1 Tax=Ideonella alba TaxID=2824118 RepID=A0A940Y9D4_9BURK|nr:hypothetical protein [Ideonella alba]MBQ0930068.1 hypothetical protein [Ideonella alba]MBQ0946128.1 hypothetical protein [Ideonella alba]